LRTAGRRGLGASAGSGVKTPRHKRLHAEVFMLALTAVRSACRDRRIWRPTSVSYAAGLTLQPHTDGVSRRGNPEGAQRGPGDRTPGPTDERSARAWRA